MECVCVCLAFHLQCHSLKCSDTTPVLKQYNKVTVEGCNTSPSPLFGLLLKRWVQPQVCYIEVHGRLQGTYTVGDNKELIILGR